MRLFKRKAAKPANVAKVPTIRQPPTLEACVTQFMGTNPEKMVKVRHMTQGKGFGGYIDPVSVRELYQNREAIAPYLRDLAGGGKYTLEFYDDANIMYASYMLPIEGPTKKEKTDSDEAKSRSSSASGFEKQFETMMTMMGTMMTSLITRGEGGGANALEMLTAVQKLKGGDAEILKEMLVNLHNNFLEAASGKGSNLQDFMAGIELAKGMATVEPESATTALISAAAPAIASGISALMASKMGGGNGKVPQPQQLQHGARSPNIAGAIPASAPVPVRVPGPGEPQPPSARQAIERPSPQQRPTEAHPEAEQPASDTVHQPVVPASPASILDPLIARLRQSAADEEDAESVARQVMTLIDTAEVFAPDNHPELLRGIVGERDVAKLIPQLDRFFHDIPEFSANPQYAAMVKAQLQVQAMQMYSEASRYVPDTSIFQPEEVGIHDTDQPIAPGEDGDNAIPEIEPGTDGDPEKAKEPVPAGTDGASDHRN